MSKDNFEQYVISECKVIENMYIKILEQRNSTIICKETNQHQSRRIKQ